MPESSNLNSELGDLLVSPVDFPPLGSPNGPFSTVHFTGDTAENRLPGWWQIGVEHSFDPADPSYKAVRREFANYLDTTTGTERILLLEGPKPLLGDNAGKSSDEIIRLGGHSRWLYWLGEVHDVPTERAEPPRNSEAPGLFGQYPADEVVLFYVTREATQYFQQLEAEATHGSLRDYLAGALRKWNDTLLLKNDVNVALAQTGKPPLAEADFSCARFEATHRRLLRVGIDEIESKDYLQLMTDYTDAKKADNPVTRISETCNRWRDLYRATRALGHLAAGRSVFDVAGWFHARALEVIATDAGKILRKNNIVPIDLGDI